MQRWECHNSCGLHQEISGLDLGRKKGGIKRGVVV